MVLVKLLGHSQNDLYSLKDRNEGRRFFKDICDKDGKIQDPIEIRKSYIITKEENESAGDLFSVKFNLSDSSIDRDQERVLTDGWDLKNYLANPIVLWAHDSSRPAIGKMSDLLVKDRLSGIVTFVDKAIDHFGWSIGQKVDQGFINAGSVGFLPKEWKFIEDPKDEAWLEIQKQELYEFSICNVPANANATVERTFKSSVFEDILTEIKALTDSLKPNHNEEVTDTAVSLLFKAASAVKKVQDGAKV